MKRWQNSISGNPCEVKMTANLMLWKRETLDSSLDSVVSLIKRFMQQCRLERAQLPLQSDSDIFSSSAFIVIQYESVSKVFTYK